MSETKAPSQLLAEIQNADTDKLRVSRDQRMRYEYVPTQKRERQCKVDTDSREK
jgi:hypothetical protein